MDRRLAPTQPVRDLAGSQPDDMAQNDDLALLLGQGGQSLPDRLELIDVRIGARARVRKGLDRGDAVGSQVVMNSSVWR